ncbi:MAG: signal transduction histidine kinase, partial [Glaciecola sp.]
EIKTFADTEPLFEPDSGADFFLIILEGEFKTYLKVDSGRKFVNSFGKNVVTGVLPYSRIKKYGAIAISCGESLVFMMHKNHLQEMIKEYYELTASLVHTMTSRVREFTKMQTQNEKLMALGKMSAGLAHELNNPASAMARSGKELKKHLASTPEKFKEILEIKITPEEVDAVNTIMFNRISGEKQYLSMIEKSGLQDDLMDFLEDREVPDAEEIVDSLLDYGFTEDDLENISDNVGDKHFSSVIHWIASNLVTEKMVEDINEAAQRISTLIGSIKSFSYMDKGQDMEQINIHEGLNSTLSLLEHRIQKKGHLLEVNLSKDMPNIAGMPGELNQVWMNILGNAVDALGDKRGTVSVTTKYNKDVVEIFLNDSGSGIPDDVKSRIFEPFFTTKGIGEGTGLGLDIVKKIIDKHRGVITVKSEPGNTTFKIVLPVKNK